MNMIYLLTIGCSDKELKNVPTTNPEQEDEQIQQENEDQESEEAEEQQDSPVVINDDLGDGGLDGEEPSIVGRRMKRMTITQISNAMKRVSGGIQWGGNNSLWEEYSDILGVPDYQNSQDEDRSPSIMFQKFLDDAATYTCQNWIEAEKSGESDLLFVQDDEDISRSSVQENIRQFRWQIQGSPFRSTSEDQLLLDDYESLFFMIHQRTSSTTESWTGICIAMFTHPNFFYY